MRPTGSCERGQSLPSDPELIRAALEGDRRAIDDLVDRLTPVVQARVARLLLSRAGARGLDVRAQVEDLTQEVFLSLFDDDGRVLASWDPERGLSLENFVGLVAHRQTVSLLRSGVTSPFTEDATEERELLQLVDATADGALEQRMASRETLLMVLDQLQLSLAPRSLDLFERLFLKEESVESISASTGLSRDAVYAWRSRLGKLARKAAKKAIAEHQSPSGQRADARTTRGM
jgi:RNA polymerase sigma factor (sigma-70 family)